MTYWFVPVPKSKMRIQSARRAGLTHTDTLKSPSPSVMPVVGKLTYPNAPSMLIENISNSG